MTDLDTLDASDLIALAAGVVASYVRHNSVPAVDLPGLIASTHTALAGLGAPAAPVVEKPTPPVPIRKTVTPDYLVSLEDGKRYKTLRRHLSTRGMTFEEYKAKWGLPSDYPSVAPNYAAQRSQLAKNSGLGQSRRLRSVPAAA